MIGQLQTTIQPGDDLFLAWSIRVADCYSSGEAIALGIDNVCLNCPPASITTARGAQQHDAQPRYNLSGQRVNADYHGIVSPTVKRLSNNSDGVPTSLLLTG